MIKIKKNTIKKRDPFFVHMINRNGDGVHSTTKKNKKERKDIKIKLKSDEV